MERYAIVKRAESFLAEHNVRQLPVDPVALAGKLGIAVVAKPCTNSGVSGFLMTVDDQFVIAYATHIANEGFRRFSVAHELGHYLLDGHADALLSSGRPVHQSYAGFGSDDRYEREADYFAARLLMPNPMFSQAARAAGDGLDAILSLSERCRTSIEATANRYVEEADTPVAVVVSRGQSIEYAILSREFKAFRGVSWPRKGTPVPVVPTADFNRVPANVSDGSREEHATDIRDWFGGSRSLTLTEEIVGLGSYGKTLTILSADSFADDDDDEESLEERWTPRF